LEGAQTDRSVTSKVGTVCEACFVRQQQICCSVYQFLWSLTKVFISGANAGLYNLRGNDSVQFDATNFPVLSASSNRSNLGSLPQPPQSDDYTLLNEDFPALPGSSKTPSRDPLDFSLSGGLLSEKGSGSVGGDGLVNKDAKYGLAGLLDVIKMTDRELNILALGSDLTTFGLNLNSAECLFSSFRYVSMRYYHSVLMCRAHVALHSLINRPQRSLHIQRPTAI
jgi:hypothetical protein